MRQLTCNIYWKLLAVCAFLLVITPINKCHAQRAGGSHTLNFDFDWRFHLGDIAGASEMSYDDASWRQLDLPHDWSIEQPFDLDNPSGWRGGYLPGGRSEEHTSELQSRENLVCRLLLEKK